MLFTVSYKVLYTNTHTEAPPQLSASVILAGGLTVDKDDIIQRNLSQRAGTGHSGDGCQALLAKCYQLGIFAC